LSLTRSSSTSRVAEGGLLRIACNSVLQCNTTIKTARGRTAVRADGNSARWCRLLPRRETGIPFLLLEAQLTTSELPMTPNLGSAPPKA
jgi:hypothetical protein